MPSADESPQGPASPPGPGTTDQLTAHREKYGQADLSRWEFHHTDDPLTRYLRDRRLHVAMDLLRRRDAFRPEDPALVVCGGVGGEGTFLAHHGFTDVTVSDFSTEALSTCRRLDPRLKTLELDAEDMDNVPDASYELVLVQDGLHHLPRPALGLTEMLRVSRRAVIVIEPHLGLAGRYLGREWEVEGDAVNYVYRWNHSMVEQVTRSYLLQDDAEVHVRRFWDHNLAVGRAVSRLPASKRLQAAKSLYATLRPASAAGNMMVALVLKGESQHHRLVGH